MSKCHECGMPYGGDNWIEAVIPDKTWNRIKPAGCDEGCGILCITCISMKLKNLGYGYGSVPVWLCGTEALSAQAGDPSKTLETLRSWDKDPDGQNYRPNHQSTTIGADDGAI